MTTVLPFRPKPAPDPNEHAALDAEIVDQDRRAALVRMADRELDRLDIDRWISGVVETEGDW